MSEPGWKQQAYELFETSPYYVSEREQMPYFKAQLAIVMNMMEHEQGKLLDIGCAAGGEFPYFRARGFDIVGIDFSPAMLLAAHQRFRGDRAIQLCRADAESLPFASASFDDVVSIGVLEYVPEHRPAVAEISRVLRPGGLAVISLPSRVSLFHMTSRLASIGKPVWRLAKRIARKNAPGAVVPAHRRNLCLPWQFRRLLREHELIPESSAYSSFFVFPLDRLWPEANLRAAAFLERFAKSRLLGWMGCQYIVAARKRATGKRQHARS